ncbi:GspJ family T2SS minor pseudopilin variant LspJ [Legionella israelensis]|uniref:Type II secretion system protein J n=1 Tax=Legionella israelensis TaxID=454 RepID=A0A0W0VH16_9GAMM|nr:GspJ family T2SS minor pseudopilin variant LspJ [Legionella israelensis]KTD19440.1 type II secretory pathway protein LspJ [Legionella israelensis]QBS08380.1 type II secretion system protein GspJ [Legionella israelensis]SCX92692.1 general secretion pathway protein J [Legionella israelensis DSM 19235]STX58013.1 general secretion pathway protein J [Legionella israelensis]
MRKLTGFTLLEVLIALAVFAILATITSTALYDAFNTREKLNKQADRLNQLQLAMSLIENDSKQITERPIRSNEMRLFPVFLGTERYVEFTRDGIANPIGQEKRSTLKRIALICQGNQLLRRSWAVLDPVNHNIYEDKILLDNVNKCQLKYLNQNLQVLSEWREKAVNQNQKKEPLPKAIQLNLNLNDWGEASLLFIIPEALYRNQVEA